MSIGISVVHIQFNTSDRWLNCSPIRQVRGDGSSASSGPAAGVEGPASACQSVLSDGDLLGCIFGSLLGQRGRDNVRLLASLGQVCRRWQRASHADHIWADIVKDVIPLAWPAEARKNDRPVPVNLEGKADDGNLGAREIFLTHARMLQAARPREVPGWPLEVNKHLYISFIYTYISVCAALMCDFKVYVQHLQRQCRDRGKGHEQGKHSPPRPDGIVGMDS